MSLRRDARHGARIARAEYVRSLRAYTKSTRRLIGLGIALLFFGGTLLFMLPTAYVAGRSARSVASIPFLGPAATLLPVALLLLAALRTLERIGRVEAEDLILMTVHPRAVAIGLIGAEIARLGTWFGIPVVAFGLAFALGLGAPWFVLSLGAVALPLACWAAVWGYAIGLGVLRVLRHLPGVRRVLKAGGFLVMIAFVIGSQFIGRYVVEESVSIRELLSGLAFGPPTHYVSLAFVGTPLARPVPADALAALVVLVALTPVGLALAVRQASVLWFTDAPTRGGRTKAKTSSGGFSAPRPFAWSKAGRIAWGVLVRAARSPQDLSHLVIVLFYLAPIGAMLLQVSGDSLGPLAAVVGVGFGTYLAGATFGLNPLGDDRPQLPLVLLTAAPPRSLVRGRMLAGIAIGATVAVLVPLASVAFGTPPLPGLALAAVGVGMCLAAAAFAVGVGSSYPVYEERGFWGTETVVPSTLVMMGYLFVVVGGTVIGLALTWFVSAGDLAATPVLLVGIGIYLLVTVGASYGSYRYAIRRYRRYTVD